MISDDSGLPFLSTLSFMLTYKCPISCPHCIVDAGPKRKEKMALGSVLGWIEEAAAYRNGSIKAIALTGGEPFYDLEFLRLVSNYAFDARFAVSATTNAYWATSLEQALDTLKLLPAIQTVSVSTDVYHQQFITIDHISNAIRAAEALGRKFNVAVSTDNEEDERYRSIMDRLRRIVEPENVRTTVTFPAGRAKKHTHALHYRTTHEPASSPCSMSNAPVVFPNGRVMACIGPIQTLSASCPMNLGNLRCESLAGILDRAETNPLLHLVRVWGPHKMISVLKAYGYENLMPTTYICNSHCDICFKLLSDSHIARLLRNILNEPENRAILAYARMHHLHEPDMIQRYRLDGTEHIDSSNKLLQLDG